MVMPFYIAIQEKDPAAGRFTAAVFSLRNISFQVVAARVLTTKSIGKTRDLFS